MKHQFITIEGNIGAGKTTLSLLLAKHYNARLILEKFADNPFLPKFYEDPRQFAFPLELFFLAERYKQLKELIQQKDLFQNLTISDYLFTKSLLFAKTTLPDDEFKLYQRLFEIINQQLVQPDLLIYLHAPVSTLQKNIKKRNRSYEQNIQDGYLLKIQEAYTQYLKQQNIPVIFVDASQADFLDNKGHFNLILAAIEDENKKGQSYISLP